jgi:hypothetical protein
MIYLRFSVVCLLFISIAFKMGVGNNFLSEIGVTAMKKEGLKAAELKPHLANKTLALDGSALTYNVMATMKDLKARKELAHAIHSSADFELSDDVKRAFEIKYKQHFDFAGRNDFQIVVYMDGMPVPVKANEVKKRMDDKRKSYQTAVEKAALADEKTRNAEIDKAINTAESNARAAQQFLEAKKLEDESTKHFTSSLFRHEKIEQYVIDICRRHGRTVKQAVYETDSQIACDFRQGRIHGVLADDGDMILYGIDMLAAGIALRYNKETERYNVAYVSFQDIVGQPNSIKSGDPNKFHQWSLLDMQIYGCILGQDYTAHFPALQGLGAKIGYSIVTHFRNLVARDSNISLHEALVQSFTLYSRSRANANDAADAVLVGLAGLNGQWVYDDKLVQLRLCDTIEHRPPLLLSDSHLKLLGDPLPQV